jgi:hypothetical protein
MLHILSSIGDSTKGLFKVTVLVGVTILPSLQINTVFSTRREEYLLCFDCSSWLPPLCGLLQSLWLLQFITCSSFQHNSGRFIDFKLHLLFEHDLFELDGCTVYQHQHVVFDRAVVQLLDCIVNSIINSLDTHDFWAIISKSESVVLDLVRS